MDALSTALGLSHARDRQPLSLSDWNAQYEANGIHHDWWFKAAVAVAGWVRSALATTAIPAAPVSQLVHA